MRRRVATVKDDGRAATSVGRKDDIAGYRAEWPSPLALVTEECRRIVERDAGLSMMFVELDRRGPHDVPSQEKAAVLAGCSTATFKRRLRLATGLNWRTLVRAWRMHHAQAEMTSPLSAVKIVSQQSGYASPRSFARAYRREFGIPPSKTRARGY